MDEAIVGLGKPPYVIPPPPGTDDVYFGGDVGQWAKVAHSLKARYYIHLIKRDGGYAQKALDQIPFAIAANSDEPDCPFQSNQNNSNPYYLFGIGRPGTMVMAPSFVTMLTNRNDPRKGKIVHTNNTSYFNSGNSNLFWVQSTSAIPLISFSEVKFIEAEARLRTGDVAGAETALAEAIGANMDKMNVDGTAYLSARGNFTGLATAQEQLERIIEEKYVAMYAQAASEVWVDYRRTGFPAIAPIPNGEAAGLNPGGQIPRRFIYPISERQTNEANLTSAKSRQGGDLMNADLWAFKN
ncbi:MAG: SusD/RagB family nutrient-binding outer membrane lipoprotein [Cyclobacteriaceae bacterium]|nr:SusD/RagB family nutrient-binding outer membrane lipoprotein [Cyclobacteriaceae bacterium]